MLLKFAIKNFYDDRDYRNVSTVTLKTYQRTLNEFQHFCSGIDVVNAEDVTPKVIKVYLMYCKKERGNKPTSTNHKLHNLKVFFNYLTEELEVFSEKTNPTQKIPYAKVDIKIEAFTEQQIKQMLNYYRKLKSKDKTFWAYRDYTIIIVFLGTGIRLGELVNLKWHSVNFIDNTITHYGKKRAYATLPMNEKLKKELADYKVYCQQYFGELNKNVFVDRNNKPLSDNAVKCIFKRLKEIMNFKNVRLSAHTFRHTFAHNYLMKGGDVFSLQKMLNHSSLTTTQKYVSLWGHALKEQNDKFNPLNDFDF